MIAYKFRRGPVGKTSGGAEQILDIFQLTAETKNTHGEQILQNNVWRNTYLIETTYTVRIPMPKYVRKAFIIMSAEDKAYLQEHLLDKLETEKMGFSKRGYQPYSGWIEVEYTQLDELFNREMMKIVYHTAYNIIKEFKTHFKPK